MTTMQFKRYGRAFHLVINEARQLRNITMLDDALWVATAAPVDSFHIDPVLLDLLDTHDDQRITVGELKEAIEWTLDLLAETSRVDQRDTTLCLSEINSDAQDAVPIMDALRKIATRQGISTEDVSLGAIRSVRKTIEEQPVSGRGIILPDAGQNDDIKNFLATIIKSTGGIPHPRGVAGVDEKTLQTFLEQLAQYVAWNRQGLDLVTEERKTIHTLHEKLHDKFEQYFTQCRAIKLDPTLEKRFWPRDEKLEPASLADVTILNELMMASPLGKPNQESIFHFDETVNPAYQQDLANFQQSVLQGASSLTIQQWEKLKENAKPYEEWQQSKPSSMFDNMALEELEIYLDPQYAAAANELLASSHSSAIELGHVCLAEKLALFQGLLLTFVNNFVSFPHLYAFAQRALFEEGTLIMDGRHFNLAVRVYNRKEHVSITKKGTLFVMYLELVRGEKKAPYGLAIPVASGTQGSIVEGKRGVFHHVDGTEWNARVIEIVDKPISLTEAILAPFIKLGEALTDKIESLSDSATKQLEKTGTDSIGDIDQTVKTKQPTQTSEPAASKLSGNLAGAGIAVAALGSSFAFTVKMLASIKWWQIVAGIGGALLAVMIPTLIIAIIRLRQRDIRTILEGSGWAINVPMRLSHAQKKYLTYRPPTPTPLRRLIEVARCHRQAG